MERWWTIDNQRLHTYREAGVRTVRVVSVAPSKDFEISELVDEGRDVEVKDVEYSKV